MVQRRNPLSLAGAALTTTSAVLFLIVFLADLFGLHTNPYVGNNIGHIDFPRCVRCHDDSHKTKDGNAISHDCETCHTVE